MEMGVWLCIEYKVVHKKTQHYEAKSRVNNANGANWTAIPESARADISPDE